MSRTPRVLLCAPASGGGKTTVTCALLQALVDRGADPVAFKCGPDYIDPMFHSQVIGAKSRNLDLFLLGRETVRRLLWENTQKHGVAVIEGVMGYYDGVAMSSQASAYDLATATQTPAVLVLDGRGAALSLAAQVKGFLTFRPDSRIRGVILNRISPAMYPRLREVVETECGVPVYGYLPNLPDCTLESRHLGLVTADEVEGLREKLKRLAAQVEETVDIDGLMSLAASAPTLVTRPLPLPSPVGGRPRIAVARDRAFCFYYQDSLALLEKLGAQLVEFSPLADKGLPVGCAGLYLGGGYPELYAKELSDNRVMLAGIRAAVRGRMPVIAECGGFLYLHKTLESDKGLKFPGAGVLPVAAVRGLKLSRFGYVTLTAETDSMLCDRGETLPAHEFHYWDSRDPGKDFIAQKPQSDRGWACVHAGPTSYMGFPHLHLCARPKAAERFVAACAKYREERS